MAARTKKTRYQKMKDSLPLCMIGGIYEDETEEDLIFAVEDQLQLCLEGQDGTEEDDPKAMQRWLKKWSTRE